MELAVPVMYALLALVITLPITTPGFYSKKNLPGVVLCCIPAVAAWYLGQLFTVIGGAVIGMLFGMVLANFWKYPDSFKPGVKDVSKRILQTAVVLLGFQMNLRSVAEQGSKAALVILSSVASAFIVAFFVGKALRIPKNEKVLIGVGTAICGGSAIAAAAPVVKASDKEVAAAVSTIFLFNVIAVFVFPAIGRLLGMSDPRFGAWAGAGINDTSSVVAAAYAFSDAAGSAATVVKLTRALLIIPVTLCLALAQVFRAKKNGKEAAGVGLVKIFPWFIAAFAVACIINSIGFIPGEITAFFGQMSKFLIVLAMTAIGLSTNIKELVKHGKKPVFLGFCCAVTVAAVSFLATGAVI